MLDAWAASPTRFREDANAEEDLRLGGYASSWLVELAQNAADAARSAGVAGRLRVAVHGTELRVANTGAPLDAPGVAALASLRASAKRDGESVGRFGVGFAAVLALTDAPRVLGRGGGVAFSAERTAGAVGDLAGPAAELARRDGQLPVLRLVWPAGDGEDPVPDGYDTEVRLPLRPGTDPGRLLADAMAGVAPLLLALPDLAEIAVGDTVVRREDGPPGAVTTARLVGGGRPEAWLLARAAGELGADEIAALGVEQRGWSAWSACWALPVDGDGRPDLGRPGWAAAGGSAGAGSGCGGEVPEASFALLTDTHRAAAGVTAPGSAGAGGGAAGRDPWGPALADTHRAAPGVTAPGSAGAGGGPAGRDPWGLAPPATAAVPDGVLHAPTATAERLSLPAQLIATVPLDPDRRHVRPGPATDRVLAAAAAAYVDLVRALDPAERLALVPDAGFPRSEVDGRLRALVLAALVDTPWLPGAGGADVVPARAEWLDVPGEALPGLLAASGVFPGLLAATRRPPAALGVARLGPAAAAERLLGVRMAPSWWRAVYAAFAPAVESVPGLADELAALPVPLLTGRSSSAGPARQMWRPGPGNGDHGLDPWDGDPGDGDPGDGDPGDGDPGDGDPGDGDHRTVPGPRAVLLPARSPAVEAVAALGLPGLHLAHPDAVHPLLERLGARPAGPAAVLAHPALRAAVERSVDDADLGDGAASGVGTAGPGAGSDGATGGAASGVGTAGPGAGSGAAPDGATGGTAGDSAAGGVGTAGDPAAGNPVDPAAGDPVDLAGGAPVDTAAGGPPAVGPTGPGDLVGPGVGDPAGLVDPAAGGTGRPVGGGTSALAAAVLALLAEAGPDAAPDWLGALALPDEEGVAARADELMFADAALRPVLADDAPLGVLHPAVAAPRELLAAAGVVDGFVVLLDDDPAGPDHDLDDEDRWWDDRDVPPARLRAVRDLDLVAADGWPRALALLAARPDTRAAVLDPGGYTGWWLARHARLGGRRPSHWRLGSATGIAALYDPVPAPLGGAPLDEALLAAVGVRTGLDVTDRGAAADLLARLADPARRPDAALIAGAHTALAEAVACGRVDPADLDLPDRVRARDGSVADVDLAVVLDRPWLAAVLPAGETVVGDPPEALAELLDLPLASDVVAASVDGAGERRRWAEVADVVLACTALGVPVPDGELTLHDTLTVAVTRPAAGRHVVPAWCERGHWHAADPVRALVGLLGTVPPGAG